MADENAERSEPPSDPAATDSDSGEDSPPTDDTYLLGASGVEEQVLAELARA